MFNLDPKKIQSMMKQMGIKQENIPAERVIIEQEEKNIIIENPSIIKVNMQGQEQFQISGDIKEESREEKIKEDDIKMIQEKTGIKDKNKIIQKLKENNGDIAQTILDLS
ncbi:nascent polypeptide-associated complex protein [Candidatus Pacearchaeota archaeon]|nr:nascent polypeptide-associated complex protein [Candidatus Pacearchaeota archaeon]